MFQLQVLADIFESLMAAVYLDSGHDLSAVWAVYTRLFPNLEAVIDNPVSGGKINWIQCNFSAENLGAATV